MLRDWVKLSGTRVGDQWVKWKTENWELRYQNLVANHVMVAALMFLVASLLICGHVECNSGRTSNTLIFGINLFVSVIFVQGDRCNQKAVFCDHCEL